MVSLQLYVMSLLLCVQILVTLSQTQATHGPTCTPAILQVRPPYAFRCAPLWGVRGIKPNAYICMRLNHYAKHMLVSSCLLHTDVLNAAAVSVACLHSSMSRWFNIVMSAGCPYDFHSACMYIWCCESLSHMGFL